MLLITGTPLWSLGEKRGASSFYNTIKGYVDHDWEVDVITCNQFDGLDLSNVRVVGQCGSFFSSFHRCRKIGTLFRFIDWFFFQVYTQILGIFVCLKHNHVLIYAYEVAGVPAAGMIAALLRKKLITRFQGTIMSANSNRTAWKLRFWDHWLALRKKADLVIMANDGTQGDQMLHKLGVPNSNIRFWMNGVQVANVSALTFDKIPVEEGDFVILALSRLVHWKRLDRIINAMPKILANVKNARLLIVGDGPEKENYIKLAESLGCLSRVSFTGSVPQSTVSLYMKRADLFVSLYDLSNVGNPLLEAMSNGLCVVTLNNGDTSTVIQNNKNGILLDPNHLNCLPEVISSLAHNDPLRRGLGISAADYARQNFWDWSTRMSVEVKNVESLLSLKSGV